MELTTILTIIIAWFVIVIAPASKLAYEDKLNKTEEKRGTSISPGIPFMPVFAIILMYAINYFFESVGTYILLITHIIFLFMATYSIISWGFKLKKIS